MGSILNCRLALLYKRLRHGRGYGVHSPLAYSLVVDTVRLRHPYYAYHHIDLLDSKEIATSRMKLIFRLVVRLRPSSVAIVGRVGADNLRKVVAMADSRIAIVDHKADMVILCPDATLSEPTDGASTYIMLGESAFPGIRRLWPALDHGLLLTNILDGCKRPRRHHFSLLLNTPKLPHQSYCLSF